MLQSAQQVREQFNRPLLQGIAAGMTVGQWRGLCNAPGNDPGLGPETTPARNPAVLERYFNNKWNLFGIFKSPEDRAKIPSHVETGFGGDPVTLFLMAFVSRLFGPVLVIRGKMPQYPDTLLGENGHGLETMTDWESRYWSVIMSEAPPSGMGTDALSRHAGAAGRGRNYTIVDLPCRGPPANATDENGVAWMDWGRRARAWTTRATGPTSAWCCSASCTTTPSWPHNPDTISEPGTEASDHGPVLPAAVLHRQGHVRGGRRLRWHAT